MNVITTTSFRTVPPFARGLVRDLRVRWAAHESGIEYETAPIGFDERATPEHLARHPFGQVPSVTVDGDTLFETGAILYAIGLKNPALLPVDEAQRLKVLSWMFAALNTIEPSILTLFSLDVLNADPDREPSFRDATIGVIRSRLERLAKVLEGREYLAGSFTVADILMATTLRFLRHTDLVAEQPAVADYVARCEGRRAFQQALAEQAADYEAADALAA